MSNNIHEGAVRDEMAIGSKHSKALIRQFSIELFNAIREGLLEDGHVGLHQFGSFKLKWSAQRNGINPQTGEPLIIAAHPRINFTAAKFLKQKVAQADSIVIESITTDDILPTASNLSSDIKSLQTGLPRTSLKKLDALPYLSKKTEVTPDATNNISIYVKSMAAGFIFICTISYFILSVNITSDGSLSSQQPNNLNNIESASIEIISANTIASTQAEIISSDNPLVKLSKSQPADPLQDIAVVNTSNLSDKAINEPEVFFAARKHLLIDGNSLWRLSKKNYINPFYWPHIYQANQYVINNPDKLFIGKTITIPTLQGHPDDLTVKDKHDIAQGYFLAYRYYKKTNKPYPYYALLGAIKYDPSIIDEHIFEIADEDWENLQIASN